MINKNNSKKNDEMKKKMVNDNNKNHFYLDKEQELFIETIIKEKSKALESFTLMQLSVYLLLNMKDTDKAIRILREENSHLKRAITPNSTYYSVEEIYPEDIPKYIKRDKFFPIKPEVHVINDIIGKWNGYMEEVIAKLSAKTDVKTSFSSAISGIWEQQKLKSNHDEILNNQVKDFIDMITVNKYIWWDSADLDTIIKVGFGSIFKINEKYYYVGAGFTSEKIAKKINIKSNLIPIIVIIVIIISIYLFNKKNITNPNVTWIYFITGILTIMIIALSDKPARGIEKELEDKKILNNIAIGLAGTSITLILASNELSFANDDLTKAFQNNLLLALSIIIFSNIIQPNKRSINVIYNNKKVQLISLNTSFYFIFIAVMLYISNPIKK